MRPIHIHFIEGEIYKRTDIHQHYGGQMQGGISTPADHDMLFLFTGESGEQYGYADGWLHDGIFLFTGEGQVGDMAFVRGNLAIRDHLNNNKSLHLFEYVRTGHVRYLGQMVCTGYHRREAPDREGNVRQVIIFELASDSLLAEEGSGFESELPMAEQADHLSLEELRAKAHSTAAETTTPIERKTLYRKRSYWIRHYVLRRAKGICEGCGQPAPFITAKGEPYLEVHHVDRLADGGPDHPEAVVGVCPNCHSRAHYAEDAHAFNAYLRRVATTLEAD